MSQRECPMCNKKVRGEDYRYHREFEEVFLDLVKRNHPQWVNPDGSSPRCMEYCKSLLQLIYNQPVY